MTRTLFFALLALVTSSFATEAMAGKNYRHNAGVYHEDDNHHKSHYNRDHRRQKSHYNRDHKHQAGHKYRTRNQRHSRYERQREQHAASHCFSPVTMNNSELQRLRALNPTKEICYTAYD